MLWKDIGVRHKNIVKVTQALRAGGLDRIRSLTVFAGALPGPNIEGGRLTRLFAYMHRMPNLEILSLGGHIRRGAGPPGSCYEVLCQCLTAIPSTVKDLELYLLSTDDVHQGEDGHLCNYLQPLLPQLRSLHIKHTKMCLTVFDDLKIECSHLQEISINLENAHIKKACSSSHKNAMKQLVQSGQQAVERGVFPCITKFVIFGKRYKPTGEALAFDTRYRIDVLHNTTTAYPSAKLGELEWIRYQSERFAPPMDLMSKTTKHNGPSTFIEDIPWRRANGGSIRLPSRMISKRDYVWCDCQSLASMQVNYATYRREKPTTKLWFYERLTGRHLVSAGFTQGKAAVPKCVVREKPKEETAFEALMVQLGELSSQPF